MELEGPLPESLFIFFSGGGAPENDGVFLRGRSGEEGLPYLRFRLPKRYKDRNHTKTEDL